MKILKTEHHQVHSDMRYNIPAEDIKNEFGSLERFREIISHQTAGLNNNPKGDKPSDEEVDKFYEFMNGGTYDYERYDDFWTDRKGGYEVSWEIKED